MRPAVKFLGAALALGLAAGAANAQVVVSSKIDTEGGVLGNIIATRASKTVGAILGAGAGALIGRAIDDDDFVCR